MEPVFDEKILYLALYTVLKKKEPELYALFRINLKMNLKHLSVNAIQSILHLILRSFREMEYEDRQYWKEVCREINGEMITRYKEKAEIKP